jgi:alanine racemase
MTEATATRAVIHLDAVRANFAEAERHAAGRRVIAVVKADAYGHGAAPVARALVQAGCQQLAVATIGEAAELRDADIELPILMLGSVLSEGEAEAVAAHLVTPVVHHEGHVPLLARAARGGTPLPVHVEVDTGMRRMGVAVDEALSLLGAVEAEPALQLEGVYTHLAEGDELDPTSSQEQLASFRRLLEMLRQRGIEPGAVHALNSAGLLAGKAVADALPEATAVRPGLMLYGVSPARHLEPSLRPAMTLVTRVVHVRDVQPGDAVGYSAEFRAERATRIATLAVGYADGIPVSASNRGRVRIRGRELPFAGRVSMDFVGVDVGDTPVEIGDEAILFGSDGSSVLPVEQAAEAAGTIPYELLVRVGSRVKRVFENSKAAEPPRSEAT